MLYEVITDRLRMTLTGEDEQRLARVPTENTEAYAAYLLGFLFLTLAIGTEFVVHDGIYSPGVTQFRAGP